ncbi:MAG: hypothetical protein C0508_05455 [Cyanobacteria bacterium PR.023]|nr:hypothetical protein [Cyanobacteria bacterium DS2.008]MBA4074470.1 hypothetical protein [Cyanobacteria bacterium PR.023]
MQHIDLPSVANHQPQRAENDTNLLTRAPLKTVYSSHFCKHRVREWYHFKAVELIEKIFFGTVTKKRLSTRQTQFFSKNDRFRISTEEAI